MVFLGQAVGAVSQLKDAEDQMGFGLSANAGAYHAGAVDRPKPPVLPQMPERQTRQPRHGTALRDVVGRLKPPTRQAIKT